MSNVYEKQTDLNTKNVVVSVAEDHMSASIVLGSIGQDGSYTYEEVIEKLSAAGVRTGIDAGKIRDVILKKIYEITAQINEILKEFFIKQNIKLIDFKLEFGRYKGDIILADEISPDTCRFFANLKRERDRTAKREKSSERNWKERKREIV